EILTACLDECLPHGKPVFRLEKLHQRTLHLPVPKSLGNIDFLLGERVDSRVVKCRGDVSGQSGKVPCQSVTNQQKPVTFAMSTVSKCPNVAPTSIMSLPFEHGEDLCSTLSTRSPRVVLWMPSWWSKPRTATAPRWKS